MGAFVLIVWSTTTFLVLTIFDNQIDRKWVQLVVALATQMFLLVSVYKSQWKSRKFWVVLVAVWLLQSVGWFFFVKHIFRFPSIIVLAVIFIGFFVTIAGVEYFLDLDTDDDSTT